MSGAATPVLDKPIVIKEGESLFLDLELGFSMDEAPVCEALPHGKKCYLTAEYAAVLSTHGCRRDNVQILLCTPCHARISGGASCALCDGSIWIASSRAL